MVNKNKKTQIDRSLKSIFDSYDADMIIVRNDGCSMLTMNTAARNRLDSERHDVESCRKGYSCCFPELCDHCPKKIAVGDEPEIFDVHDDEKKIYSVTRSAVEWVDGKPATAFFLRDVNEERSAQEKMFKLAHIDQLTGVPNRQKLKEDFEAVINEIDANRACGIIAIFDLDNFKNINDTYGHNTGDAMLQRMSEHLESDSSFKGHLYRVGGDEFVLFYKDDPKRFDNIEEFHTYYKEILSKALLSYTMPNIEVQCTLSIGVAFFPAHGDTLSELLRKSDIALYNAKENGKNQLVLFEDRFDSAKKFKDMYINMQPILVKNGNTYGYELVDSDRTESEENDSISLSEFDRALDALGLNDIKDSTKYFISFTKQMLNISTMKNLPRDKFVIQIPATGRCTEDKMKAYKQLHSYGYALALVNVTGNNLDKELLSICDYCRFATSGITSNEQGYLLATNANKTFIAPDVATNEDFEKAQRAGFTLFQGYFFSQSVVTKKEKDIEPLKVNYFRLLQITSTDDFVDFNEISDIISSDVALSYKLLRLLNSAMVGLRTRVSSILMAITYLGEESLKQWIAVLALRGIADEKPLELVRLSLIRARFGELLAPSFKPKKDARHVFMTGLLSLLHIALEKTKEDMLAEIPVADEIRESLLKKDGPYSDILKFFTDYEHADWGEISRFSQDNAISCSTINDAYIKAVKWCNDLIEES
ncbi:MAG: diguanylate cyclase [Oscillospiraceae bacterium]